MDKVLKVCQKYRLTNVARLRKTKKKGVSFSCSIIENQRN